MIRSDYVLVISTIVQAAAGKLRELAAKQQQ
jgi:hypothetical protein